jgi:hypothetical protein
MLGCGAVYHRAMGLFRIRIRRSREKAAARLPEEREGEGTAQADTAAREGEGTAQADTAAREVTAEARPDPDQPGWGRIAGQAIGKSREHRQQ